MSSWCCSATDRGSAGQDDDVTWVVMSDPDGNEFCVLRAYTDDERAAIAAEQAERRP